MIGKSPKKEKHKRPDPSEIVLEDWFPLVHKVLNRYDQRMGSVIQKYRDDLFCAGCIGLIKALGAYDPEKGTFATIAWLRISSNIGYELTKFSKYDDRQMSLEDVVFPGTADKRITCWEDSVGGAYVDYYWIGTMIKDYLDRLVYFCLMLGFTRKDMKELSGVYDDDILEEAIASAREESLALVDEMYKVINN